MSTRGGSTTNLRQGGRHGRFPAHTVADEDTLLDAQLGEEVFQIVAHRFIGQHRAVRAVAVVTGIYSQHLTGQRTVRTLGMERRRQQSGEQKKTFTSAVSLFCWPQLRRVTAQTMAALCTQGDEFLQASQREDYLSVFITTVQTVGELYQMTSSTLVDCIFPVLLL